MPTVLDGPMVPVIALEDLTLPTGEQVSTGTVAYVNKQQATDGIRHGKFRGATDEEVKKFGKTEQAKASMPSKAGDAKDKDKEK